MYAFSNDIETHVIVITIPQRKADPKDKNRLKWVDAKQMALEATGCVNTQEVRKWLNVLRVGSRVSLRMTSGWVAVSVDLAEIIKAQKTKTEQANMGKVVQLLDCKKSTLSKAPTDVKIVLSAMLDTIALNNWEYLRLALIDRQQHKVTAWKMLSFHEQQQLKALVPQSIRLLKEAVKRGAIAGFKEDDEGDIFLVWKTSDSEPELLTGTSIAQKFNSY